MVIIDWISDNWIELFGAITGVIYVFLEIRQIIWLWPLGILTSAFYVWVFFTSKLYADMSLQTYYVVISFLGWYWWLRGRERNEKGSTGGENKILKVTRLRFKTGVILAIVFVVLYQVMWLTLSRLTDSPVPGWDAFLTSLSIIATWMLAKKIYEQWYLWIIVNLISMILYFTRGLYPTVLLYFVYGAMSFAGLKEWKRSL